MAPEANWNDNHAVIQMLENYLVDVKRVKPTYPNNINSLNCHDKTEKLEEEWILIFNYLVLTIQKRIVNSIFCIETLVPYSLKST